MSLDYLLADGQADPGTFLVFPPDQALEDLKHFVVVLRINPGPVVLDPEDKRIVIESPTDANLGLRLVTVFDRVRYEVVEDLPDPHLVADERRQVVRDGKLNVLLS